MTAARCEEVERQLELFALGEVDEPERSAVRAHLAHCPACSQSLDDARRLLGLLDLHFNEAERLARLRGRVDAATARPRRVLRFPRQLAALAALLLLTIALTGPMLPTAPQAQTMADRAAPAPRAAFAKLESEPSFGEPVTLSGGAEVRPAIGAVWRRLPGNQVELTDGMLKVRVGPLGVQPVAVRTPAGAVVALDAEFTVTARPARGGNRPSMSFRTIRGSARLYPSR